MDQHDDRDKLPGTTDGQERGSDGESERAAEERVRALEEALGRLLTVSPSPALLAAGAHGEEGAADYLAAYDRARKAAQETLGPYQLDLGLVRTQAEHAQRTVGHEFTHPPTLAEVRRSLEREMELER